MSGFGQQRCHEGMSSALESGGVVRADLATSAWNELSSSLQDPNGSRTRQNTNKLLSNRQNEKKNGKKAEESTREEEGEGGREGGGEEGMGERLRNEARFWDDLSHRMCVGVDEVRLKCCDKRTSEIQATSQKHVDFVTCSRQGKSTFATCVWELRNCNTTCTVLCL